MSAYRVTALLFGVMSAVSMPACSDDFEPDRPDMARDQAASVGDLSAGAHDLAGRDDIDGGTPVPSAPPKVRLAHLSPDSDTLDVCLVPHGSGFTGAPIVKSLPFAPDEGLAYRQVSQYVPLAAEGQQDARLVFGDSIDCSDTNKVVDIVDLPALAVGQVYTLAVVGFGTPPANNGSTLRILVLTDEVAADPSKLQLRFVHVAPDSDVIDVGSGIAGSFAPIFSGVTYTKAGVSASPPSDPLGYTPLVPFTDVTTFSVRAQGSSKDLSWTLPALYLSGNNVVSMFFIGAVHGDPSVNPLKVLTCVDNAPPGKAQPALATCLALGM
jgi:hypothetical protein